MSVFIRGTKNALRNPIRTGSVVLLLGVVVAFALSLLLADQAVKAKISNLKTTGATNLIIRSAGNNGPEGGGEPLTTDDLNKVANVAHVAETAAELNVPVRFRIQTGVNTTPENDPNAPVNPNVSLDSSINAGTLGIRQFGGSSATAPKLPVRIAGIVGGLDTSAQPYKFTSGGYFSSDDVNEAIVGNGIAAKNNLSIGSKFQAYGQDFKVVGIFDGGTEFANDGVFIPLKTIQRLSGMTNEVSLIIARVDTIDNFDATTAAVKNTLGTSKADVTSSAQNTQDAIAGLKSIEHISLAGVVIALASAVAVVFLVMLMIVRERKREIAVLKAIGGSNFKIILQFMTESVAMTLLSLIVAGLITFGLSGKITNALIASNVKATSTAAAPEFGTNVGFGGGGRRFSTGFAQRFGQAQNLTSPKDLVKGIRTDFGTTIIIEGIVAVIAVGALGSALPAFAISKVRPSEVLRGE